jgi:hypothetical protein
VRKQATLDAGKKKVTLDMAAGCCCFCPGSFGAVFLELPHDCGCWSCSSKNFVAKRQQLRPPSSRLLLEADPLQPSHPAQPRRQLSVLQRPQPHPSSYLRSPPPVLSDAQAHLW